MSIALMTKVWNSALPTSTHKLVLLAFADYANDGGLSWPSIGRIAVRSQLSRRQTQRIIADLQSLGVLARLEKESQHDTPLYKVRGDKLTPLLEKVPSGVTSEHPGVTSEGSGVTFDAPGVTPTTRRGDIDVRYVSRAEPSGTTTREPPQGEPLTNQREFFFFDEWKRVKGKAHPQDPRRKEATG